MPMFDALLARWKVQGYELVALESLYRALDVERLPRCEVVQGTVPGRSGMLALQGDSA